MHIMIRRDEDPWNPREWDNLGTVAMRRRDRFNFSEETVDNKDVFMTTKIEEENPEFMNGLDGAEEDMELDTAEFDVAARWEKRRLQAVEDEFNRLFIHLPIYVYEHSGIAISTGPFGCSWDSGQVGIIYVSRVKAEEELGLNTYPLEIHGDVYKTLEEHATKILDLEIKTLHQFITGEVYGYEVVDDEGDAVDACWGFFSEDWGEDYHTNGMAEHWPDEYDHLAIYRECPGSTDELLREATKPTIEETTA